MYVILLYSQAVEDYKKSITENDSQCSYTIHLPVKIKLPESAIRNIDVVTQMNFSEALTLTQVKSDFKKMRKTFQKGRMSSTRNYNFIVYNT